MSAPRLVETLRGQKCPLSIQFFSALSLCHTVMAEWKEGSVFMLCLLNSYPPSDKSVSPHVILQRTLFLMKSHVVHVSTVYLADRLTKIKGYINCIFHFRHFVYVAKT